MYGVSHSRLAREQMPSAKKVTLFLPPRQPGDEGKGDSRGDGGGSVRGIIIYTYGPLHAVRMYNLFSVFLWVRSLFVVVSASVGPGTQRILVRWLSPS